MAQLAGYIIAVLIGISLGLIGGGGSILTVPVLVYLLHADPVLATTYSLFIVGFTSLVGGTRAYINKLVDFRSVSLFGIPSILTVFIARHFILPHIPELLFTAGNLVIKKGSFLMLLFALLMLIAAISMICNYDNYDKQVDEEKNDAIRQEKTFSLLIPRLADRPGYWTAGCRRWLFNYSCISAVYKIAHENRSRNILTNHRNQFMLWFCF